MTLLRLDPRLGDHVGGVVVVTRFDCPHAWMLLWLRWYHRRVAASVARESEGFIRALLTTDRRTGTAYSVTLWRSPTSLYDMGRVPAHIDGVRRAARLGIRANAAVFPYVDHWSNVMFGSHLDVPSPLAAQTRSATDARRPGGDEDAEQRTEGAHGGTPDVHAVRGSAGGRWDPPEARGEAHEQKEDSPDHRCHDGGRSAVTGVGPAGAGE